MNSCIFCNKDKIREDIIYEGDNFFLKVGFGLVTAGHILLISKDHYSCYATLPDELYKEYSELKEFTKEKISRVFSYPFLVEYGVYGQSVNHAHTHFIPSRGGGYNVKSLLEEMVLKGDIRVEEINSFNKLKEIYNNERGYVSIEENNRFFVCHVNGLPPMDRDNPNPYLSYRAFFLKRGVKGIKKWEEMSKDETEKDNEKRKLTKAILKRLFQR